MKYCMINQAVRLNFQFPGDYSIAQVKESHLYPKLPISTQLLQNILLPLAESHFCQLNITTKEIAIIVIF